jgi:arsenite methyltransferase
MSSFPRRRAWIAAVLAVLLLCACTAFKRFAYEGFGRDDWQKPGEVVAALAIRSGDRVADLGSGGGYFTFRLAQAVGPAGKVYAVDVDSALLDDLAERAKEQGYGNVARVLAKYDDPMLPESGVDLVFTSNVYHHLEDRVKYFSNAAKYLRPGGRVAIIDFRDAGFAGAIGHATPVELIKKEMGEAGYRLKREYDFLEKQSFLVFSRSGD